MSDLRERDVGSLGDFRTVIWERHGLTLDDDDPVMVYRTIHELALSDLEALLSRHNDALTAVMTRAIEPAANGLKASIEAFQAETLDNSLREKIAQISEQSRIAEATLADMKRIRRQVFFISLGNAGVLLAALLIFATLLQ